MSPTLETRTVAVADLALSPQARQQLDLLLSIYTDLKTDFDLLKDKLGIEQSKIGKLLADQGIDKSRAEEFTMCWVRGSSSSKIHPEKLIAQGVTQAMIDAATVRKPKKDYFQIRGINEKLTPGEE